MALTKLHIRAAALVAVIFALVTGWLFTGHEPVPVVRAAAGGRYANFEGPETHPLAMTPDGTRLLAVNTPNATLSVFRLEDGGEPVLVAEIPVGLEPVSVAARDDHEAWVVNWMSDSVSVVDLVTGNVTRTIDVGDEPADVVFAGPDRGKAFVSVGGASHVKVLDASDPAASPQVIPIRGRQPRALTTDATGSRVFVSVFRSGNGTTIVPASAVKDGGGAPPPSPAMAAGLPSAPTSGLVVKQKGKKWVDERGKGRWKRFVPYRLADVDVVVLDAAAATPEVATEIRGVGTTITGSAFDPATNRLYVANSEAHNVTRFEPNLRGRFLDSRVSIVDLADTPTVQPVDLNPHVDYTAALGSDAERETSLALPNAVARGADGALYVAATGSAKVGVLDTSGAVVRRIAVGRGPTGLAVDDARGRLYVLSSVDRTIGVVDPTAGAEVSHVEIGANPEPADVAAGRRIFYDTTFSAHGTVSCASCHMNGHADGLAWDLGDPTGSVQRVDGDPLIPLFPSVHFFHPMKGPMVTQSLRALGGTGPLHWRGDREDLEAFNPAFVSLLGAPRELTPAEFASFRAFVDSLVYPPNPNQGLDRLPPNPSTGPSAARGRDVYLTGRTDQRVFTCNQCHAVTPGYGPGTNGLIIPGIVLLMGNGVPESQDIKVPQLRGLYERSGGSFERGEQIDGFGLSHDGAVDNLDSFLRTPNFAFPNDQVRRDLEAFVLALDTGTAPAVGLQVTIDGTETAAVRERVELLVSQADLGNCDLVVRGIYAGARRVFRYVGARTFETDTGASVSLEDLLSAAHPGAELTFTGVPAR